MPVTTECKILVEEYPSKLYPLVMQARFFAFFLVLSLTGSHAFADIFIYGQQRAPAQTWSVSGVGHHNGGGFENGQSNLVGFFPDSSNHVAFDGTAPFQASSSISHTNSGGNSGSASGSASIGSLNSSVIHRDPFVSQIPTRSMNDVAWYDAATINSPGLAGQIGIMNVRIDVQGLLQTSQAGPNGAQSAGALLWFTRLPSSFGIGEPFQFDRIWGARSDNPSTSLSINESLQFDVSFRFGTEFEFYLRGLTQGGVTSNPRPTGESSADLSIQWGGIQSITHNGNIVDFSMSTNSGFNYISSVPEPSTLMLVVVVAGVTCFNRPRRKQCIAE